MTVYKPQMNELASEGYSMEFFMGLCTSQWQFLPGELESRAVSRKRLESKQIAQRRRDHN